MFATIGGLGADRPGFEHLYLRPRPGGGLTHADASYESIRGRVELAWELAGDELRLDVWVPPNVGATLVIPTRAPASVTEGGLALEGAPGVTVLGAGPDELRIELVSGSYSFTCREPAVAGGR
jgi:alpha-L-rhamnosidase